MRGLRLIVLSLMLILLASGVQAAVINPVSPSLTDLINAVERPFKLDKNGTAPLQDLVADFFQRSTLADKQKEVRGDGQMYLRTATSTDPLMFRFDYFRPTTQEVVCDGRTLWVYLRENRQVIQSDVTEEFSPFNFANQSRANNFLQGLGQISRDFEITFPPQYQDPAGNFILELTPRRASVSIAKLFITVNRDTVLRNIFLKQGRTDFAQGRQDLLFPIRATTVIDHQGNQTTMEFSNVKTNSHLPNSFFMFNVPGDVQVVRPPTGR
jgi:outer membrane lipoprotein carrier protein